MQENASNLTTVTPDSHISIALVLQYLPLLAIIGSILIGVIISMLKYLANVTSDIILIHKKGKKSFCRYSDNPEWLRHSLARAVVRVFTPWRKYNKSIRKWEESFDNANDELSLKTNKIEKFRSSTDDDTREFIESEDMLKSAIEKIISEDMKGDLQTAKSTIKKDSDGRCTVRCGGRLVAYSYSYEKAKKIEKTLRDIIDDEKTRELLKNRYNDFQKMNRLEELFRIKLAWLVGMVRLWNSILPFKQITEYKEK